MGVVLFFIFKKTKREPIKASTMVSRKKTRREPLKVLSKENKKEIMLLCGPSSPF